LVLFLGGVSPAGAQPSGSYNLDWNTFDAGGATFSTGGAYKLGGTAGQPDAGPLTGGVYQVLGGFWNPQGAPIVGIDPLPAPRPTAFAVLPNVPNPFRRSTRISFLLPESRAVAAAVFDVHGKRVRTLLEGPRDPGRHDLIWDGRDHEGRLLQSGVYWVRVDAGEFHEARRVVLLH
jgi:hypothetical protein